MKPKERINLWLLLLLLVSKCTRGEYETDGDINTLDFISGQEHRNLSNPTDKADSYGTTEWKSTNVNYMLPSSAKGCESFDFNKIEKAREMSPNVLRLKRNGKDFTRKFRETYLEITSKKLGSTKFSNSDKYDGKIAAVRRSNDQRISRLAGNGIYPHKIRINEKKEISNCNSLNTLNFRQVYPDNTPKNELKGENLGTSRFRRTELRIRQNFSSTRRAQENRIEQNGHQERRSRQQTRSGSDKNYNRQQINYRRRERNAANIRGDGSRILSADRILDSTRLVSETPRKFQTINGKTSQHVTTDVRLALKSQTLSFYRNPKARVLRERYVKSDAVQESRQSRKTSKNYERSAEQRHYYNTRRNSSLNIHLKYSLDNSELREKEIYPDSRQNVDKRKSSKTELDTQENISFYKRRKERNRVDAMRRPAALNKKERNIPKTINKASTNGASSVSKLNVLKERIAVDINHRPQNRLSAGDRLRGMGQQKREAFNSRNIEVQIVPENRHTRRNANGRENVRSDVLLSVENRHTLNSKGKSIKKELSSNRENNFITRPNTSSWKIFRHTDGFTNSAERGNRERKNDREIKLAKELATSVTKTGNIHRARFVRESSHTLERRQQNRIIRHYRQGGQKEKCTRNTLAHGKLNMNSENVSSREALTEQIHKVSLRENRRERIDESNKILSTKSKLRQKRSLLRRITVEDKTVSSSLHRQRNLKSEISSIKSQLLEIQTNPRINTRTRNEFYFPKSALGGNQQKKSERTVDQIPQRTSTRNMKFKEHRSVEGTEKLNGVKELYVRKNENGFLVRGASLGKVTVKKNELRKENGRYINRNINKKTTTNVNKAERNGEHREYVSANRNARLIMLPNNNFVPNFEIVREEPKIQERIERLRKNMRIQSKTKNTLNLSDENRIYKNKEQIRAIDQNTGRNIPTTERRSVQDIRKRNGRGLRGKENSRQILKDTARQTVRTLVEYVIDSESSQRSLKRDEKQRNARSTQDGSKLYNKFGLNRLAGESRKVSTESNARSRSFRGRNMPLNRKVGRSDGGVRILNEINTRVFQGKRAAFRITTVEDQTLGNRQTIRSRLIRENHRSERERKTVEDQGRILSKQRNGRGFRGKHYGLIRYIQIATFGELSTKELSKIVNSPDIHNTPYLPLSQLPKSPKVAQISGRAEARNLQNLNRITSVGNAGTKPTLASKPSTNSRYFNPLATSGNKMARYLTASSSTTIDMNAHRSFTRELRKSNHKSRAFEIRLQLDKLSNPRSLRNDIYDSNRYRSRLRITDNRYFDTRRETTDFLTHLNSVLKFMEVYERAEGRIRRASLSHENQREHQKTSHDVSRSSLKKETNKAQNTFASERRERSGQAQVKNQDSKLSFHGAVPENVMQVLSALESVSTPRKVLNVYHRSQAQDFKGQEISQDNWKTSGSLGTFIINVVFGLLLLANVADRNGKKSKTFKNGLADILLLRPTEI